MSKAQLCETGGDYRMMLMQDREIAWLNFYSRNFTMMPDANLADSEAL